MCPAERTYTDGIVPCAALFLDMEIGLRVKESPAVRYYPAHARTLEKRVALLFALLAGVSGVA